MKIDDTHFFRTQVANGQLEKPIATATLKLVNEDNVFAEHFVVMKNLTGPIRGFHFMRQNSVVISTTHGLIYFIHLTMQAKNAEIETSAKHQLVPNHDSTTVPSITTKTVTALFNHQSEWHATGTLTPVGKITEAASLIISHSFSTIFDKKTVQNHYQNGFSTFNREKHTGC